MAQAPRDFAQVLKGAWREDSQAIAVVGSFSVTNPSVGVNGQTAPTSSNQVGGQDPSGNLQPFKVSTAGNLKVDIAEGTITAENPSVSNTGAAVPAYGTYLAANNAGNLTGLTSTSNGLAVDGSAVTQPVSAASLPLPANAAKETGGNLATIVTNTTGLATAAAQTTGNTSLATIATNTAGLATSAYQSSSQNILQTIATNTAASGTPVVSGTVIAKIEDSSGNSVTATSGSLNVNVKNTVGNLVPFTYDTINLTYITSGNGTGSIGTAVYQASGVTVATLTLSYDSSNRLSGVVRT